MTGNERSGGSWRRRAGVGRESSGCSPIPGEKAVSEAARTTVEFPFGAVFTSIRTIPLPAEPASGFVVADLLPTATGHLWVADAGASVLRIYSQEGRQLRVLSPEATGLRRPVSLTAVHGRWVAALDAGLPAISILDELGRPLRRFPLPELDRPSQVCNLSDRRLAVIGTGWGRASEYLVHLYSLTGEYIESLFGAPRVGGAPGRAYGAGSGDALFVAHSLTDSVAIYDVGETRDVVSFDRLRVEDRDRVSPAERRSDLLEGLYVTACGQLLALYAPGRDRGEYRYDLHSLRGDAIAVGVRSAERVVGVEGSLFYSLRTEGGQAARLRVWRFSGSLGEWESEGTV